MIPAGEAMTELVRMGGENDVTVVSRGGVYVVVTV